MYLLSHEPTANVAQLQPSHRSPSVSLDIRKIGLCRQSTLTPFYDELLPMTSRSDDILAFDRG